MVIQQQEKASEFNDEKATIEQLFNASKKQPNIGDKKV